MAEEGVDLGDLGDAAGRIPADRAAALAREGRLVLVDIRTPAEWSQTGVPAGAALAPLTEAPQRVRAGFVEDIARIAEAAQGRPVALICRSGGRTALARRLLLAQGFTRVLDIAEGMAGSEFGPGWLARGLPLDPWPPAGSSGPTVTAPSR
jgi:rhodanese-related sulfurtransferase